jgi:predicted CopG family antitoxin
LRRIVVSEDNYLELKKLGQAGDSFNEVISYLLRMQGNYQQEKEENERQDQKRLRQQQQQQKSRYDIDSSMSDIINELSSPSFIEKEALEKHRQEMDELFRTIEEKQENKR